MILGGKPVNPGELRTPITLEQDANAAQTGGFQTPAWTTLATVYSRWRNAHGYESLQAALVGAEAPATVLIRYRSGIDTTCAVTKNGVRYEIVSVDNIEERSEYLELKLKRMGGG